MAVESAVVVIEEPAVVLDGPGHPCRVCGGQTRFIRLRLQDSQIERELRVRQCVQRCPATGKAA